MENMGAQLLSAVNALLPSVNLFQFLLRILKSIHCLVLNSTNTQLFINCSFLKTMGILLNFYGQLYRSQQPLVASYLSSAFLVLPFLEGDINGRINSGVFCFTLHSAPFFKMMLKVRVALLTLCSR